MFDIILDSRKPSAVAFRKWVTKEVLPTIEGTGGYMLKGVDRFKWERLAQREAAVHRE